MKVERIRLQITEDRINNSLTSPGAIPIQLFVPCLLLTRDMAGFFTVLPLNSSQSQGNNHDAPVLIC